MTTTTVHVPAQREVPPVVPERRRLHLAASCYVGLALVVTLTVLISRHWSAFVSVPLFLAGAVAVVTLSHPQIPVPLRRRLTRRR